MPSSLIGGQLLYFFGQTVAITAIVAPLVLWRYATAVRTGMGTAHGVELAPPPPCAPACAGAAGAGSSLSRLRWERGAHWRVIAVWYLALSLAALLLAVTYVLASGWPRTPTHVALAMATYVQLVVPIVAVSLGWTVWRGLGMALLSMAGAATVVVAMSILVRIASGRAPSIDLLINYQAALQFAALTLPWPLAMFVLTGTPRVRGVAPVLFGGLFLFALAPFVGAHAAEAAADTLPGSWALLQVPFIWAWIAPRHLFFALLALPFGALMAWRLSALARGYAAKRFSDVQMLARAWWLMFCAIVAIELVATEPGVLGFSGCVLASVSLVPFLRLSVGWIKVARGAPPARTLLLLRAFGYRVRTERLLGRIGSRWRYHGPVTMIAAPDVVARTIDPADFLAWLLGRVNESFVRNAAELQARLAAIDRARDPDGRFRINEFCCADTTWRATVVELMDRADVVLMDLRGFGADRQGCAFELHQLSTRIDPARVVLVVTPGADRAPLHTMLGAAAQRMHWQELPDRRTASTEALFGAVVDAAR